MEDEYDLINFEGGGSKPLRINSLENTFNEFNTFMKGKGTNVTGTPDSSSTLDILYPKDSTTPAVAPPFIDPKTKTETETPWYKDGEMLNGISSIGTLGLGIASYLGNERNNSKIRRNMDLKYKVANEDYAHRINNRRALALGNH